MPQFLKIIDKLLDRITMYRLVLYYLIALILAAIILSLFGLVSYSPQAIAFNALYLTVVCVIVNTLFARAFRTPENGESAYITALILALIITPMISVNHLIFLSAAGVIAMASKYILAFHKKHIFNPAAVAVAVTALAASQPPSWWIGTAVLLPFVIVGGVLLARKLRRIRLVLAFFVVALAVTTIISMVQGFGPLITLKKELLDSSLFFLGFVMLTEPLTMPPTLRGRLSYAILVGILFPPQINLFGIYTTPEYALLIGNIYSFIISPKIKLVPKLVKKNKLAPDITEFVFQPEKPLKYRAGQYIEMTIPPKLRETDSRGNRRFFTLSSSPTEKDLRFGLKFYEPGSKFKTSLAKADSNTPIAIGQLAGDFTLPRNKTQKLCFVAGGIGITPYRSIMKYLLDQNEQRDIALFYSEKSEQELVYRGIFDEAAKTLGAKVIYGLETAPKNWQSQTGRLTAEMIKSELPDYQERLFYVSGPYPMVAAITSQLRAAGVPRRRIKTDFFPGYA
jgi:ferredoxin-NADP reductase